MKMFALASSVLVSSAAFAGNHIPANNCEIFLDKITPYWSSHSLRAANIFVKIRHDALDGRPVEVGFRNRQDGEDANGIIARDWTDLTLYQFVPSSSDYFQLNLPLRSDFGYAVYQGAFYVKTDKDTYYWAKNSAGTDFIFDTNTYNNVMFVKGTGSNYDSSISAAVPTQAKGMEYYNSKGCR